MRAYDAFRSGKLPRKVWQKLVNENKLAVAKNMPVEVDDGYI